LIATARKMLREPYHTLADVVHRFEDEYEGTKLYYQDAPLSEYKGNRPLKIKFRGVMIDDHPVIIGTRRTNMNLQNKTGYLFARIAPWHEWIRNENYRAPDERDENGIFPAIDGKKLPEQDDRESFGIYYGTTMVNPAGNLSVFHASAYSQNRIPTVELAKLFAPGYNPETFTLRPTQVKADGTPLYDDHTLNGIFNFTLALIRESAKQVLD